MSKERTSDSTRSVKNTKFFNFEKSFSQSLENQLGKPVLLLNICFVFYCIVISKQLIVENLFVNIPNRGL